jgi:hypothetical protein
MNMEDHMGRRPINGVAMTPTEASQRHRAKIAAKREALEREVQAARAWRAAVEAFEIAQARGVQSAITKKASAKLLAMKAYDAVAASSIMFFRIGMLPKDGSDCNAWIVKPVDAPKLQ